MNIFSLTAHWKRVKYLFAYFQKGTSPKKRDAFLFAHETNSIYSHVYRYAILKATLSKSRCTRYC